MSTPDPTVSLSPPEPTAVIPPLPGNATPEEKDAHWFKHVYAGDTQKQLTVRAVLMGGVLGMFMSISNLYTVLKLGWSFNVAITSCVLSFVIWNALRALCAGRLSPMSILETNCMQSTASAAGYSTGTTVGTALAAIYLIQGHHQPWTVVVPFVLLTAALGVFLAIPMKRQMINQEQLPFPSGIAAAETIRSLYSKGAEALHKAWSLVIALIVSAAIGFIKGTEQILTVLKDGTFLHRVFEFIHKIVPIPDLITLPGPALGKPGVSLAGLGFEPGVLMVGAGMIMGLRAAVSMLVGSAVLYYALMPALLSADLAHAGVAGWNNSLKILGGGTTIVPRHWGVWGGTSLMVFASLASLAVQWRTLARAFRFGGAKAGGDNADALAAIEVPGRWLVIGLVPITVGLVILLRLAFNVNPGLGLIAVVLSFVLALVACRATGETDTTPIGPMGKVTQLLYAMLPGAVGDKVINLVAAGTTACAAGSASDLLTDLKSGYLLGANPRRQFLAQFCGIFFGTLAIVPAWYALASSAEALNKFPLPSTSAWRAMADLLATGVDKLPTSARSAVVFGGLVGLAIPLAEKLWPRARNWLPSAMGLGLGFVVDFSNSLSFAIGGVITLIWTRLNPRRADTFNIPVASGFVAGEALVLALIAIFCAAMGLLRS